MAYWLVKSDPDTYSWENLKKDKSTVWDGVRNYQARNNLLLMKTGDEVLFYHSQEEKSIVGIAKVSKEYFPDSTAEGDKWFAVELEYYLELDKPVSLEMIKSNPHLSEIGLNRQGRLSVMPLTDKHYSEIIRMSK